MARKQQASPPDKGTRQTRDGRRTQKAIQDAAVELFFEHGYEATSLREVASLVGIQVGSLYNHMSGKDQLLRDIMVTAMEELLDAIDQAIASRNDAFDRLVAGLDCHIRFHAEHRRETFIGNSELRALSPEDLKAVLALRKRYETTLGDLLREAADFRGTDLLDAQLQTYSVLALGTHVASWYRPGKVSLDRVVSVYTELVLRQLAMGNND